MGLRTVPIIAACLCLAACGQHKPAAVFDLKQQGRSSGATIAAEGDSASSIAGRYQLTVEDIIALNDGGVAPGRHVRLPPPRQYRARNGDTVQKVANMFDLRAADVIAQNNLQPPYALYEGQVIHLVSLPGRETAADAPMAAPAPRAPVESVSLAPVQAQAAPQAGMFARPVEGRVISGYGLKADGRYNDGINIAAAPGTPVLAAREGTVVYAGSKVSGYGNMVMVRHADEYFTIYSHLADTRVAKGAQVARGQVLGGVGTSGQVKTPQLHFEIRKGTQSLDPSGYF